MNIPTIEPLPSEEGSTESSSLPAARRRRQRRVILPQNGEENASFLYDLSRRILPSYDFFLYSLLAGIILGIAFITESSPLLFLGALLSPFLSPVIGIALGTITGTARYLANTLASLVIGCVIVFGCGWAAGWSMIFWADRSSDLLAQMVSVFSWGSFVVMAVGAGWTTYLLVRSPEQNPLIPGAAMAYGLYAPISAAGFGLARGNIAVFTSGMLLFFVFLLFSLLISALVFGIMGLKPLNSLGYILCVAYTLTAVAGLLVMQANNPSLREWIVQQETLYFGDDPTPTVGMPAGGLRTATPTAARATSTSTVMPTRSVTPSANSETPTPPVSTPTRTLIPTQTSTLTLSPQPTPFWARVAAREGGGILIRSKPDYTAPVVQTLINSSLVEILPDTPVDQGGGSVWVHIRTVNNIDGWVIRALLNTSTNTPQP